MAYLEVQQLSASYGDTPVLDEVSLGLERGETKGLIGPSGSGKSSLLRAIIGLLPAKGGRILFDGAPLELADRASVRELRNRVAIVFQQYNLFQNMTVLDNVTFAPIHGRGRARDAVIAEAEALLRKVGLGNLLDRYPDQLSGGQQQRVAIARALALKPELLLLDEVTSALDPELVNEVLDTIAALAADGMTMLIVSHEMAFIRQVASELILMDGGRIVEQGAPETVLRNPTTDRGRQFSARIHR